MTTRREELESVGGVDHFYTHCIRIHALLELVGGWCLPSALLMRISHAHMRTYMRVYASLDSSIALQFGDALNKHCFI